MLVPLMMTIVTLLLVLTRRPDSEYHYSFENDGKKGLK